MKNHSPEDFEERPTPPAKGKKKKPYSLWCWGSCPFDRLRGNAEPQWIRVQRYRTRESAQQALEAHARDGWGSYYGADESGMAITGPGESTPPPKT